jgi:TonB family protein
MLERLTEDHLSRRRRRPRPAVLLSVAAHAAAIVGLLVFARWQIDKLETSEPPVLLAGFALPAPAGDAEPAPEVQKKPRSRRRTVRDTVQPSAQTEAPESRPGDRQGDGRPTDGPPLQFCAPGQECESDLFTGVVEPVCGDGRTEGREQCDDGGRVAGDGCSASCRREVAEVQSRLIEGSRIAGDPQIPPPPSVHAAMLGKGQPQVKGTVKMCLDRDGAVQSVRVLESTGHPLYDELLTSRMQSWRYRPYKLASGVAVPVCTSVTFIYRIR